MELGFIHGVILGVIQGVTEFLPISSSAHLALSQRWMGLDPDSPALLLFDALSHVGTLVSVSIVFAAPAGRWLRRLKSEVFSAASHEPRWDKSYATRLLLLAIAATVPTGIIGLTFKDTFEAAFDKPFGIGVCLCVTGCLLGALVKFPRGRRGWREFRFWQAVVIGIAQGCAILPGISRSGSTISTAAFCGLRRRWAVEFSFLLAVPAILGGAVIKLLDTGRLPSAEWVRVPWGPVVVGTVVATIFGVIALRWLLTIVRRARLHYFAVYCWIVGLAVAVAYR